MKNTLKIWHLLEGYPPEYGGGAAVTVREICRSLAARGHEVRALCIEGADAPDYSVRTEFDGDVRVDRVNLTYYKRQDPDGFSVSMMAWRRHQRRINELLKAMLAEWTPDIADYHTVRPLGEQALKTIQSAGVPILATLHEAWLICPRLMLLRSPVPSACSGPSPVKCLNCVYSYYDGSQARALLKLPWRAAKLGIYPAYRLWQRRQARATVSAAEGRSQFMARVHRPHLSGPVRHVDLGIDLSGRPSLPHQAPRTPLRFGFVGGFQPTKGIDHLLAAARAMKADGITFELHVWGPGTEEDSATHSIRGLEDRVFLRGMYRPEDRWNVYGEMDVALMATKVCEPLGRVPIEAAAAGIPTIAPAIGGIVESIRDGIDGLLYEFLNPNELERQMRRVLTEDGLVQRLTADLPPVTESAQCIAKLEEFYYSVLAAAAGKTIGPRFESPPSPELASPLRK